MYKFKEITKEQMQKITALFSTRLKDAREHLTKIEQQKEAERRKHLSERERKLIEGKRLPTITQSDMAERIGIATPTYVNYELGKNRKEMLYILKRIAEETDCSIDYLLGLTDDIFPQYEPLVEKTGLNGSTINNLIKFHNQDSEQTELMDFINCFIGNDLADEYLNRISSLLRQQQKFSQYGDTAREETEIIAIRIANQLIDYLTNIVMPMYTECYNEDVAPSTYDEIPQEPNAFVSSITVTHIDKKTSHNP